MSAAAAAAALHGHKLFAWQKEAQLSTIPVSRYREGLQVQSTFKSAAGKLPVHSLRCPCALQIKTLVPQDRVLLLGNARDPAMCVKKDADALKALFPVRVMTPLPTPASRMVSMLPCSQLVASQHMLLPMSMTGQHACRQAGRQRCHIACDTHSSRSSVQVVWQGLVQQLTGRSAAHLDMSSLSHLSGNYSPGAMRKVLAFL